jgi:hypothetical protein
MYSTTAMNILTTYKPGNIFSLVFASGGEKFPQEYK